jgi:hypothetical protein
MKLSLILLTVILLSTTCSAKAELSADSLSNTVTDSFILKKNESREIGNFKVKMLSVGHTFGKQDHAAYANLEISENGKLSKPTIYVSKEISLGDKYLKLLTIDEKTDPKLSDPFASTSCILILLDEPTGKPTPKVGAVPAGSPTDYCFKNSGLKTEVMITFALDGNKVSDGEFGVSGYDNSTSGETYHFKGTKTGSRLTVKFTGTIPAEFDKIKKLVWTLGKNNLKVQMYGKNYQSNKWGVYTATFDKCEQ